MKSDYIPKEEDASGMFAFGYYIVLLAIAIICVLVVYVFILQPLLEMGGVDVNDTENVTEDAFISDFSRGYYTALKDVNDRMTDELVRYSEYISYVVYQNKTYPIRCEVIN